jgi:hypothetical protein
VIVRRGMGSDNLRLSPDENAGRSKPLVAFQGMAAALTVPVADHLSGPAGRGSLHGTTEDQRNVPETFTDCRRS